MWAVGRRSGFFIVSYAPLAAMFVALDWPSGWSASDVLALGVWIASIAVLLLVPSAMLVITGRMAKVITGVLSVAALIGLVLGILLGWPALLVFHPGAHRTPATASAIAFGFCVLAVLIVALLLYNARRAGSVSWTVTDPRDQGGAVAGYLVTYLLPLLNVGVTDWRIAVAYVVYFATLYVIYIRSEGLVLVNPTLYLFRYRIYDVQIDTLKESDQRRVLLLTRRQIRSKTKVTVVPLGDGCYLEGWVGRA